MLGGGAAFFRSRGLSVVALLCLTPVSWAASSAPQKPLRLSPAGCSQLLQELSQSGSIKRKIRDLFGKLPKTDSLGFLREGNTLVLSDGDVDEILQAISKSQKSAEVFRDTLVPVLQSPLGFKLSEAIKVAEFSLRREIPINDLLRGLQEIQEHFKKPAAPSPHFVQTQGLESLRGMDSFRLFNLLSSQLGELSETLFVDFFNRYPKAQLQDLASLVSVAHKHSLGVERIFSSLENFERLTLVSRQSIGLGSELQTVAPKISESLALLEIQALLGKTPAQMEYFLEKIYKNQQPRSWTAVIEELQEAIKKQIESEKPVSK